MAQLPVQAWAEAYRGGRPPTACIRLSQSCTVMLNQKMTLFVTQMALEWNRENSRGAIAIQMIDNTYCHWEIKHLYAILICATLLSDKSISICADNQFAL